MNGQLSERRTTTDRFSDVQRAHVMSLGVRDSLSHTSSACHFDTLTGSRAGEEAFSVSALRAVKRTAVTAPK